MFIRPSRVSLVALIASVGLFAACEDSEKPSQANSPAASVTVPAKPKGDELPADMVAAVAANRAGNAVSMHFTLGAKPEVNKALPVDIAIVPNQEFEKLSAHFLSQNGLAVSVGENYGPLSSPAVGKPLRHQLVLLPGKDGVFVLTGSIDTIDSTGNFTRIFSIPVVVSPPGVADAAAEATTAQPQSPSPPATN
jgi:hypothetical protein